MFDALKWPWRYQTLGLAWYVPDFILKFEKSIAVEVKPEITFDALKTYAARVIGAGWDGEVLVLGAGIFSGDVLGVLGDDADVADGGSLVLGPGVVFQCINCGGGLSLMHGDMSHRCRVSGCYAGNAHAGHLEPGDLYGKWNASSNRVQWKGPMSGQQGASR